MCNEERSIELFIVYLRVDAQLFVAADQGDEFIHPSHSFHLFSRKDRIFSLLFEIFLPTNLGLFHNFLKLHDVQHRKPYPVDEAIPGLVKMSVEPLLKRMALALDVMIDSIHCGSFSCHIID